jgi:hypothetical protein
VLRLSSDGYLCVGIDFKHHQATGAFKFMDPKTNELHMIRAGRIAPPSTIFTLTPQTSAPVSAAPGSAPASNSNKPTTADQ